MKSTTRTAADTRIAAMNGAMTARSVAKLSIGPLRSERERGGLLDRLEGGVDRAVDDAQDQPREQAEDDDQGRQRDQRHRLDGAHVGQVPAEALEELGQLAE